MFVKSVALRAGIEIFGRAGNQPLVFVWVCVAVRLSAASPRSFLALGFPLPSFTQKPPKKHVLPSGFRVIIIVGVFNS
jgi:hypothetical protein